MSVATEGVKGYEYQYKVTVLFALLHCNDFKSQLYVEKIGSEDITFLDENKNYLEIQIKREKNTIGFPKVIEWLSHFQERSSTNNLLFRVKNKKSKCLFITRSRCNDEALIFLKQFPLIDSNQNSISKEITLKIQNELKVLKFKDTQLDNKRKSFCNDISDKLNKSDIEILLNNTLIWEQIEEEKIDNEVLKCLNKKFSIPLSLSENLYLKLLEIVKQGRDLRIDIVPVFKDLILKSKINKYSLSENNISRKEEQQAIEILKNSNLLLLTGISQCGKTELAKKVANEFIDRGYNSMSVSSEIFQIENFFNQNKAEDKILIFEDPFGHIKPKNESNDIKNKIKSIARNLPLNHKLIITSKIEILKEAFSDDKIIDNVINLTEDDNKLLLNFWLTFSKSQFFDNELVSIVGEYILNESKDKIQVGQLDYLSRYDLRKLKLKTLGELISIARHNANDISDDLIKEKLEESKILGIMSLCCDNSIGVNVEDLSFILSDDEKQYSVFKENKIRQFLKSKNRFPKYSKQNKIKKKFKRSIEYFEERGFIKYHNNNYFFSHPNYFEVGKNLFFRRSFSEQIQNIEYLKKSIVCINPVTSLFASKLLSRIYNKIDIQFKENIKELMFLANQSIFPSVEDYSSINLINIIEDIKDKKEKRKIDHIINRGNTDSGAINWHNNEVPFISRNNNLKGYYEGHISKADADTIQTRIINNDFVKLFDIWCYVNYYRWLASTKTYVKLDNYLVDSLLKYEEVFIRKQIAKIFFLSKIEKNEVYLIEKIFNDIHPTVVFYGIWGSLLNWSKQSEEVRKIIFKNLKRLFNKQEIAIRANNLISTFSIDYSGESIDWKFFSEEVKVELWNVWAQIFPIFSKKLPPHIPLNYGRFGHTMKTSMKYLTLGNGMNVFNAWLDRIEFKIENHTGLSDYEMAIIIELIKFTKEDFKIRKNLFKRILSNKNSIFSLYNFAIVTDYWDELDSSEKKIILNLLGKSRIDLRWLKAVLLNKIMLPKEIELELVGEINLFTLSPKDAIKILSEELIHDCLKIIYAKPYELEYLRFDISDFWKKMINYILFYQIHPFFDICIKDFIGENIWGARTDNYLLWRKICRSSQDLNYLLYIVIYNISKSAININDTKNIIDNLIYAYKEKNQFDIFVKIISEEIEVLQQTSEKRDIFSFFNKDFIFDSLYKGMLPDLAAKLIIENAGIEFLETIVDEVQGFRFFYSYMLIKKLVDKDEKMAEETKTKLLSIPNKIDDIGKVKQHLIEEKYFKEVKIEDWVY